MNDTSVPLEILRLSVSTALLSIFFAAGMAVMLAPIGLLMDMVDASTGHPGLMMMLGLAGLALSVAMAWYSRRVDSRIPLPELTSGETIMFRQFGYAISSTKYDPARIIGTSHRLFVQPVRFNPGGRIPSVEVSLSKVAVTNDGSFGRHLARSSS